MQKNTLKEKAYLFCQSFIEDRIARIHNNIFSIQESLSTETKSSAGDKHETGRAMLQLEREKLGVQLAEAESTKQILFKVNIDAQSDTIRLGSIVKTSNAIYFVAISAGEFTTSKTTVFCISIQTPIAKLLLGKAIGESAIFNGNEITILEIV